MGGYVAGAEMHLRHALVITRQKADQHIRQEMTGFHVEAAHDAEIHRRHAPILQNEDVARMHVRVEVAVSEYLIEEDTGGFAKNLRRVMTLGSQGLQIIRAVAAQALQCQDAAGSCAASPRAAP